MSRNIFPPTTILQHSLRTTPEKTNINQAHLDWITRKTYQATNNSETRSYTSRTLRIQTTPSHDLPSSISTSPGKTTLKSTTHQTNLAPTTWVTYKRQSTRIQHTHTNDHTVTSIRFGRDIRNCNISITQHTIIIKRVNHESRQQYLQFYTKIADEISRKWEEHDWLKYP